MSLTFKKNKKRDIPFVSSSILNSFVGCKYRYWHEFIKNDGYNHYREDTDDESIYLTFGTIVHGSIENFWKVKRTKKNLINEYEKLLVENGFTDKSYIDLGYEMLGFACFVTMLIPSTRSVLFFLFTAITLPSLSLSFPAITLTISPFLIFILAIFVPPIILLEPEKQSS